MSPETKKRLCGNFCVVVHVDGNSEVKIVEEGKSVFEKARELIGCRFLDHIIVQSLQKGSRDRIEFLVNDEGYLEYGNDPSKVNQIATAIYNRGEKPGHYILGDVVICLMVEDDDGGDFKGMSYGFAMSIMQQNNRDYKKNAMELVPRPTVVPDPVVKITSYGNTEDMLKAMNGDTSVKPMHETIISGNKHASAEA